MTDDRCSPARRLLAAAGAASALILVVLPPSAVWAQDPAGAEALFTKGLADMNAGRFDAACPALVESQRLDPRPGTLFTAAECFAKAGKVATSVAYYEDYLRSANGLQGATLNKHTTRIRVAHTQIDKLRPSVPTVTLTLASPPPSSVHLRRDGNELSAASLGTPLPVDPGDHLVVIEIEGHKPVEQRFAVELSEHKVVDLTALLSSATIALTPPPPAATADLTPAAIAPATAPSNSRRIVALSVAGVGAASLVFGSIAGGVALSDKGTVDAQCHGQGCSTSGLNAVSDGKIWSTLSTVGFVAGGVALATGGVLYFTWAKNGPGAGDSKPPAIAGGVSAGPLGASIQLKGVF